jgi:aspartyl-tRNA(Asn)/glutamyl-tRNA(Gln) amidotransferase subunit A
LGSALSSDIRGKRIGIPKEYRIEGVPAEIDAVWSQGIERMRDAGAETGRRLAPAHALRAADLLHHRPAEASSNLARYDGVKYGLRGQAEGGITNMYEATRAKASAPR